MAVDEAGQVWALGEDALHLLEMPSQSDKPPDLERRIKAISGRPWQALDLQGSPRKGELAAKEAGVYWINSSGVLNQARQGGSTKLPFGPMAHIGTTLRDGFHCVVDDTDLIFWDYGQRVDLAPFLSSADGSTLATLSQLTVDPRGEQVAVALQDIEAGLRIGRVTDAAAAVEELWPSDGARNWTPRNVEALHFDDSGRLWFATSDGLGVYCGEEGFRLWGPADGLPWSEITSIATEPSTATDSVSVWLGTTRGLVHLTADLDDPDSAEWSYKQGPRWLPHDHVHDLVFDARGTLWAATEGGVAQIAFLETTLQQKAEYFDAVIDAQHKRTEYGYVDALHLPSVDADLAEGTLHSSDNDGLWTSMYGAAQSFAWASTGSEEARRRARDAFRAVAFLSEVTQGGTPAMQPGFPARSILPASGPNPNDGQAERDREIQQRDRKWKSLMPRWGTSADGEWFWKADTSSDELDGHYFFYGVYYDLVADDDEKAAVREVVHRITDHLLRNDYSLVDHDGEHTRWAVFGPRALNNDASWWEERGLNSMSVLSYLRVAEHVSATPEQAEPYAAAARDLIANHGYAASARHPKVHQGPGTGNQSDDEMALMNLYNLLRYERDPELLALWAHTMERYWTLIRDERNPLFHFLFAGALDGQDIRYADAYDDYVVRADLETIRSDALETLVRYPLDRRDWPLANSHRQDVELLRSSGAERPRGHRTDGRVLPIDERFVGHWNHDPWALDFGGAGTRIADGASYLLPYYLGRYYGFIE